MTAPAVMAAWAWKTNGELIADAARLGYLRANDHVLDPTFGEGVWWSAWQPEKLTSLVRGKDGSDFRCLPYPDGSFDAVAYDPPYVCPGGRATSTIKEMHGRYGMNEGADDPDFSTPEELQQIINDGLTEVSRLVRPSAVKALSPNRANGIILVKCKDYVWSGRLFEGTYHTRKHAESLGLVCWDRFEHIGDPGPQPTVNPDGSERGQFHARRNLSTLFVFRRGRQPVRQDRML